MEDDFLVWDGADLERVIDEAILKLDLQPCNNIIYADHKLFCYVLGDSLIDNPCGGFVCPYFIDRHGKYAE